MRPEYIILVEYHKKVVLYELYYNRSKAFRALEVSRRKDKYGNAMLYSETSGANGLVDDWVPRLVHIGKNIRSSDGKEIESFYDCNETDYERISEYYKVPVQILKAIAQEERNVLENKRFLFHTYGAHTEAIVRKYAPKFFSRFLYHQPNS